MQHNEVSNKSRLALLNKTVERNKELFEALKAFDIIADNTNQILISQDFECIYSMEILEKPVLLLKGKEGGSYIDLDSANEMANGKAEFKNPVKTNETIKLADVEVDKEMKEKINNYLTIVENVVGYTSRYLELKKQFQENDVEVIPKIIAALRQMQVMPQFKNDKFTQNQLGKLIVLFDDLLLFKQSEKTAFELSKTFIAETKDEDHVKKLVETHNNLEKQEKEDFSKALNMIGSSKGMIDLNLPMSSNSLKTLLFFKQHVQNFKQADEQENKLPRPGLSNKMEDVD